MAGRTRRVKDAAACRSDAALLRATAAREVAAFERLYRRFHPRVFGFALRLGASADRAEEAVSDTMVAVWRAAGDFRGEALVSTWIFGIAYRVILRKLRSGAGLALQDPLDDNLPDARTGPEVVEALFERERVAAAIARLPVEQAATVQLTHVYGYRLTEIAEITGVPVGTVKTRMFHARTRLRRLLSEGPDERREAE